MNAQRRVTLRLRNLGRSLGLPIEILLLLFLAILVLGRLSA